MSRSSRPKNVTDLYALSPMQQLMLLHALGSGDSVLANQIVYQIDGDLDEERFAAAWRVIVARHPALRTAFLWEGLEKPVQVVRGTVELPFQRFDLSGMDPETRQGRVDELRRADREKPFRLGKAPLIRCTLIRLTTGSRVFIWSVHHLIADRWSHGTLFTEMQTVYDGLSEAPAPERGEAPGFGTYVRWVEAQPASATDAYWTESLKGFAHPTLVASQQRVSGWDRTSSRTALPVSVTEELHSRASASGTTLGSWVQAAVALALADRSGRQDVVYGLTVSGRPSMLPDAERIVGSFVNNVPARFRLAPGSTVQNWIRSIQVSQAERQRFEHASLAQIVASTALDQGGPLFDLLVLVNLAFPPEPEWETVSFTPTSVTLDAGYPMLLAVTLEGARIGLTLVHDAAESENASELLEALGAAFRTLTSVDPDDDCGAVWPVEVTRDAPVARAPTITVVPPGSSRGDILLAIWREVLGHDELTVDDDFFALGGTSLQAAQVFLRVERALGRTLPLSTLFRAGSVRELLRELDEPLQDTGPLVGLRSTGSRPPLFVVPGIGGNVVGLAGLARALGSDQPFYGLNSRGLDGECEPFETIEEIARDYAEAVAAVANEPVDLLGLCWGAAVAFEMVVPLEELGHRVRSLALLDPAVLLRGRPDPDTASPDKSFLGERVELYWDEFREADWRGRSRFLLDKAKRAAGAVRSKGLTEESRLERNQFRVRKANRIAVTRYDPSPGSARARLFITPDRTLTGDADPRLEWLGLISPTPDITHVPGVNSGDTISPAHVAEFGAQIDRWLTTVRTET